MGRATLSSAPNGIEEAREPELEMLQSSNHSCKCATLGSSRALELSTQLKVGEGMCEGRWTRDEGRRPAPAFHSADSTEHLSNPATPINSVVPSSPLARSRLSSMEGKAKGVRRGVIVWCPMMSVIAAGNHAGRREEKATDALFDLHAATLTFGTNLSLRCASPRN